MGSHLPSIRDARTADLPALARIENAADTLFPPGRIPTDGGSYSPEGLEHALEVGQVLVAEESGGELVGFSVAIDAPEVFHLELIAVHPDHGRKGLGRRLLHRVFQETRRRGRQGTTLTTFRDLPWNAPFYQSCGFEILSGDETSTRLKDILTKERELGMKNRVAMWRPTDAI